MLTFAMKGCKEKQVGAAYSHTELEIRGNFHCHGPQIVGGEGGAPTWVYDLFCHNQAIKCIAITTESGGVVYTPIKGNEDDAG